MSSTTFLWRLCAVGAVIFFAAQAATAFPTFLVNPGVYTATASSTFNDPPLTFPVANLFDGINSTESVWAIQGFLGGNSQGRDEGWVSVTLDQTYLISDILFAPRKPSGNTDGIDQAYIWISDTPFGVNVTSSASTNAFLTTPTGLSPNLAIGPFPTAADVEYSLAGGVVAGKYLLGRFTNLSDQDNNRNLGVRTLAVGVVPEPRSLALAVVGMASLFGYGGPRGRKLEALGPFPSPRPTSWPRWASPPYCSHDRRAEAVAARGVAARAEESPRVFSNVTRPFAASERAGSC